MARLFASLSCDPRSSLSLRTDHGWPMGRVDAIASANDAFDRGQPRSARRSLFRSEVSSGPYLAKNSWRNARPRSLLSLGSSASPTKPSDRAIDAHRNELAKAAV